MTSNLIPNGDFFDWPLGTSFTTAGGSGTTPIAGDLSWVASGASQPVVTLSQQEHPVTSSVKQGFPRYFFRLSPSTAPALGTSDKAYLSYKIVETIDRSIQGQYGTFTFWARGTATEIVVQASRSFGTGGHTATGATQYVYALRSFQISKDWMKYQLDIPFTSLPGATYGAGSAVEVRIYMQGGATELGTQQIAWRTGNFDFSQVSLTLRTVEEFSSPRLAGSSLNAAAAGITTIYATDPTYGAVGNYSGTQNTAGTGFDNRAAIQAALNAAYTQGPGGFDDTINGTSYRVVIPKGKYYISAPADGTPSLKVPLKVELDFSEAELHFDRPPLDTVNTFGHGISEPNPLWCGILVGNMGSLSIGKMQMKPNQDQTYGGAWYGMTLDAIRVQEADTSWIRGGGRERLILGFRGAAIRYIACINNQLENLLIEGCCFSVIQSYFGTAFAGYQRYRGTSQLESTCVDLFARGIMSINIYKKGFYIGVNGDYHTPAAGGLEVVTFDRLVPGGPVSLVHCSFENVAEEIVNVTSLDVVSLIDIRMERTGAVNTLGTIYINSSRGVFLEKITWLQQGGTCLAASYTGPLASVTPNPAYFLRCDSSWCAPSLKDIYVYNDANRSCQWVGGTANITYLPVLINPRTEQANMMQGTNAYMQNLIPENDGGRVWSVSTIGLEPQEAVNGITTVFSFLNGFIRQKPKRILVDGLLLDATDAAGTNWTWTPGTGQNSTVTFAVAPTKKVRAFF